MPSSALSRLPSACSWPPLVRACPRPSAKLLSGKKKRGKAGEKSQELTPTQREENQHLARKRVYVEHGVRRCKAWRILRDELRLGRGLFPLTATVGLVRLRR